MSCASRLREKSELGEKPKALEEKIEEIKADEIKKEISKVVLEEKKIEKKQEKHSKKLEQVRAKQSDFVESWPFGVGEKSTYIIRYGPLDGGEATIEVAPLTKLNGEVSLHYVAHAQSLKIFDWFYRVDDVLESWVRLSDHLPLRQEILQNESGEWGRRVVLFDQNKKTKHFYSSSTRPKRETKITDETYTLFNNPQDILGAYFFARFVKNPMKINFPVHDRAKHWNNEYNFEEKEEIKTRAGTFMCNRYHVFPRVQGKLEPQGNALVWITDDDKKIMVKFKVKIKIGSITGDLIAYQPGQPWNIPMPYFTTPLNLDPNRLEPGETNN